MPHPEYRPNPSLRMIWSPPDAAETAEDAELHALADRIFAAAAETQTAPVLTPYFEIHRAAVFAAAKQHDTTPGVILGRDWPDRVAAMLAAWPAPIVAALVLP